VARAFKSPAGSDFDCCIAGKSGEAWEGSSQTGPVFETGSVFQVSICCIAGNAGEEGPTAGVDGNSFNLLHCR
jgi:hypothetical protein